MPLTNSQYDTIMRQYNQRQIESRHLLENRRKQIYQEDPALKELDDKISSFSVHQAKLFLNGNLDSLAASKEKLHSYILEKKERLKKLGHPASYLTEPDYHCALCKDTGYIGHEKCDCFKKAAVDLLYSQSNIQEILKTENFDNFSLDYYEQAPSPQAGGRSPFDAAKDALTASRQFTAQFDTVFENILLYGDTGVGKTFLSNCIAKELIDTTHSVIYYTAFDLFEMLGKSIFRREQQPENMQQYIFDCDLLIIDDLGTEVVNQFTSSQLFLIINERLLRKKSTIISTNLTLGNLDELYSERTFSRISSNYIMLKLIGNDIRIQKKLGGSINND